MSVATISSNKMDFKFCVPSYMVDFPSATHIRNIDVLHIMVVPCSLKASSNKILRKSTNIGFLIFAQCLNAVIRLDASAFVACSTARIRIS